MKRKRLALLLLLILAALLLSGCGMNDPIDVTTTEPSGLWQSLVVWPLAKALIWIEDAIGENGIGLRFSWGWAIVIFTMIIKIVTLPLTITQIRGMQAQRELQPRIQALQKKYGKDREKLSQEQMKLYQEAGVNPLSGCLPLIVQMPILFGLYHSIIVNSQRLEGQAFFWIPDLSFPSYTGGLSWIPQNFQDGNYLLLASYLVLPILLVITQFAMQKWMTPATPDTGGGMSAGMMKQMGLMMTFMFGFFTLQVPAALSLYWVTSNLLQMGQQWFITNRMTSSPSTTSGRKDGSVNGSVNGSADIVDSSAEVSDEAVPVGGPSENGDGLPLANPEQKKKPKRRRSKRR